MKSQGSSSISPRLDDPLTIIVALKRDAARVMEVKLATGTSGGLLDSNDHAQSIFKHAIIRHYLPPFLAMTGSTSDGRRLVALGATRVRRDEPAPPMSAGFIVLTDPEGNEFCLD
jgi:hypothetical protein